MENIQLIINYFRKGGSKSKGGRDAGLLGSTRASSQKKKGISTMTYQGTFFTEPSIFTGSTSQSFEDDAMSDRLLFF